MNKVNAFCKKEDFYRSKVLDDGRIIVRYGETEKDGTVEYTEAIVDNTPEAVKELIREAIMEYDSSPAVNGMTIRHGDKEIGFWLPAEKRGQLANGVTARKAAGSETYTLDLRDYGVSIEADCDKLLSMLSALENYAVESYNVTSRHLNELATLDTVEAVIGYDYRSGYPEKLTLEL